MYVLIPVIPVFYQVVWVVEEELLWETGMVEEVLVWGQLDHPAWPARGAPVYEVLGTQSVCWASMAERAAMAQNPGSCYLEVSIVLHCIWFIISWLVMA